MRIRDVACLPCVLPALCVAWLAVDAVAEDAARAAEPGDAEVLFVRRVAPLLQEKCLPCHGGDPQRMESSLDVRSRESLLRGGDSGQPALVPGQPDTSPLYLAVTRTHESWSAMPPKEADKLTPEQVGWLRSWIVAGASWPDAARAAQIASQNADRWSAEDGVTVRTSGGLSAEWTNRKYRPEALWAYRPVAQVSPPPGGRTPIDAFLEARMPSGLTVAPPADRATLIRRATFDLTGLPPTPEEVAAFVADPLPDELAFAKLVERLLASPHYGERMAQHWLDVVRYADTSGLANDFERGNAWRYRDYVVRSFNDDKPYDQFIREQIAGDEIDPDDPAMLVAVGMLRMGPWELTAMEVPKVARQRFLDDVTNSVGETFLAQSLQCARCHDHKFDPIPTRDYYAVQAVFATTQIAERPAPFLPEENTAGFDERRFLEQSRADHVATLRALDRKSLLAAEAWLAEHQIDPATWRAALKQVGSRSSSTTYSAARSLLLRNGVPESQIPPRMLGWTPEEMGRERIARKGLQRLAWELERYEPVALSVYSGRTPRVTSIVAPFRVPADSLTDGELEQTCILAGGDPFSPGQAVEPGVLSVLDGLLEHRIPHSIQGRRLAFAHWVADPDNPLTTRAIVNRIWLWHFQRPLAGNPNNFGATGKRPTHPELLDYLAATFVQRGWSIKAMHRLLMNTDAYRRSAQHPDRALLAELDPLGTSYAAFPPRRLTAEELRDAMLAASGELNPALGGIPNRPEMHREVAMQPRQVMGTFAAAYVPNPLPHQRHRRSLYAVKIRGLRDPFLEVFNQPSPETSCEWREASTVTPQVFSLLNGEAVHRRALALAHRVLGETRSEAEAIDRCFLLTLGRVPEADERAQCLAHWHEMHAVQQQARYERPEVPLVVRREAVEENSGERFSYDENLYAYAEFVPDLHPADVPPRTRALADVCLVLLNTNEFLYVY